MKTISLALICLLIKLCAAESLYAQGTAFTYQGRLNDGGSPAGGSYDLTFTIYDSTNIPGNVIAGPITNSATLVSNGLFTTTLDFGSNVFNGNAAWLEIGVRTNGNAAFATLSPRQQLTPTPYAMFANTASNLSGTVSASQLSGTLAVMQLPSAVITNNQSGVTMSGAFTGSFIGNGSGLTNIGGSTAGNYVFAYDTTTQTPPSYYYTNITFNSVIQTNGWYYTSSNATFTATQNGLCLVQYTATIANPPGTSYFSYIELKAVINNNTTAISGSDASNYVSPNTNGVAGQFLSRSFITYVSSGQQLSFQFCANGVASARLLPELEILNGQASYAPSFSVTIVRIQ
jgi:hypothetical protein